MNPCPFTRPFHGNKLFLWTKIPLLGNTLQFYPEYVANYNVICSLVLLPRLVVMATINNQSQDDTRRREIALELMEAYVSLTCCCILFITLEKLLLEFFRSISSIFPSCILGYYLKLVTSPQLDLISLHMPIVVVKLILLIHVGDELSARSWLWSEF